MTPLNWGRIISVSVFSVSFIIGMTLVTWFEIAEITHDTPLATIIAIIVTGRSVVVVSAGLAAVVEGAYYIMVIAYHMVQRGIERGRQEGIAIGETKGRTQAYEDVDKQLEAYYKRMRDALEAGEDFNEPPPKFSRNGR